MHVFNTRTVLLAGDFNATLMPADANNQTINKPHTVQALHALIEDHLLIDLGANVGCLTHTWASQGFLWSVLTHRFDPYQHSNST
jgi:hypothetical protein